MRFLLFLALTISLVWLSPRPFSYAKERPRLDRVLVEGRRLSLAHDEIGSTRTVITGAEIERQGASHIADVLRGLPGVSVSRSGSQGSFTQVRLRGSEANHTLVILDGVELNSPAIGSELDFSDLSTANIERIEVLRGPQSAFYGSDAIGGVIKITTKRAEDEKITSHAQGAWGSLATHQESYNFGYDHDGINLRLALDNFATEGISTADVRNGNKERDGYSRVGGQFALRMGPQPSRLDILVDSTHSRVETDGFQFPLGPVDDDSFEERVRNVFTLRSQFAIDDYWRQELQVSLTQQDSRGSGNSYFYEGGKTKLSSISSFNLPPFMLALEDHQLKFLLERENDRQRNNFSPDVEMTTHSAALFYQAFFEQGLSLGAQLRRDGFTGSFQPALIARLAMAYRPHDSNWGLHASLAQGHKNPTLIELYGYGPSFVGNRDLAPERATSWDLGIEKSFAEERLAVDLTLFSQRIRNLISTEFDDQFNPTRSVNLGGVSRIYGLEVSGRAQLSERIHFSGFYTYLNATDAQGLELVRRPRHNLKLQAGYDFADIRLRLDARFRGRQADTGSRGRVILAPHLLADASLTWDLTPSAEIYVQARNLFDRRYQEVYGYGREGLTGLVGLRLRGAFGILP